MSEHVFDAVDDARSDIAEAVSRIESGCHPLNGGRDYSAGHNDLNLAIESLIRAVRAEERNKASLPTT